MSPEVVLAVFVILVLLDTGLDLVLSVLNYRHVRAREGEVPEAFRASVSLEEHRKASAYSLARTRLGLVELPVMTALSLAAVLLGLFGLLDRAVGDLVSTFVHGASAYAYFRAALVLALTLSAASLVGLPFSLYSTFVLERKFGFNTTTLRTWFLDGLKSLLLSALLGLPLLWLLFAFMDAAGKLWWLWAAAGFSSLSLVFSVLYPRLIAPLFNKFTPLPEGSLRTRIEELAGRSGFSASGIYVMDGSKRSRHSNAYFTGLGKARRIVLYDTLVSTMTEEEVLAVLAHEIGHWKKGHVPRMTAVSVAFSFLGFWILSLLMGWPELYLAFGFSTASGEPLMTREAILLVFGLASGPATFFLTPFFSAWSRRHEYEADRFAAEAAGAEAMAAALLCLNKGNASNLAPHPLYSAWYYSHPAPAERLAALQSREP